MSARLMIENFEYRGTVWQNGKKPLHRRGIQVDVNDLETLIQEFEINFSNLKSGGPMQTSSYAFNEGIIFVTPIGLRNFSPEETPSVVLASDYRLNMHALASYLKLNNFSITEIEKGYDITPLQT